MKSISRNLAPRASASAAVEIVFTAEDVEGRREFSPRKQTWRTCYAEYSYQRVTTSRGFERRAGWTKKSNVRIACGRGRESQRVGL